MSSLLIAILRCCGWHRSGIVIEWCCLLIVELLGRRSGERTTEESRAAGLQIVQRTLNHTLVPPKVSELR